MSSEPPDGAGSPASPPTPPPDGVAPHAGAAPLEVRCDLCGGPMIDRHCKLVCARCGYQRDCSDP